MAYEGELVRMENGRWARYQSLRVCHPGRPAEVSGGTILVAVELDEPSQELLRAAERSFTGEGERAQRLWPSFQSLMNGAALH